MEGIYQRVGNVLNTYILRDNWILTPITHRVHSLPKSLFPNAKVQEFIDPNTSSWNRPLVFHEFSLEGANIVYIIPLRSFGVADKRSWWLSKDGNFTVKLAYHLEMERSNREKGEESAKTASSGVWKAL